MSFILRNTRIVGKAAKKDSLQEVGVSKGRQRKEDEILAALYTKNFLSPNVLFQLWELYSAMDVDLGAFQVIYMQQKYSSYFCSVLWLKVEHIKILYQASLAYKAEGDFLLLPLNEDNLRKELATAKVVYELLTKTLGEILDFMAWNKNLRWEKRFHLERVEHVYKQHWTEISAWQESIEGCSNEEQAKELRERMNELDAVLRHKLLRLHKSLNLVTKEATRIKQLNEQIAKCIKLNVYMQYSEAQTLSCELSVVQEIEKFHSTYEEKSNNDVRLIISSGKRTIAESKHASSLMKNKYGFQQSRVPSLGPFGLHKVPQELHSSVIISIQYRLLRLNKTICSLIPGLKEYAEQSTQTQTNKISLCPFTAFQLESMGVSTLATQWMHLPPIVSEENSNEMAEYLEIDSPLHLLTVNGGFAFYDGTDNLVSLHALGKGSHLFFSLPLFRNLQLRQYKFNDELLHYASFPVEPRLFNSDHKGCWVTPADYTPEEDMDDPNSMPKWAFVFKDTVEEEAFWPHYAFECAPLPYVVVESRTKKYKPSEGLRNFRKAIESVREYWALTFPSLQLSNRRSRNLVSKAF